MLDSKSPKERQGALKKPLKKANSQIKQFLRTGLI